MKIKNLFKYLFSLRITSTKTIDVSFLEEGKQYIVIRQFTDFDGQPHPVGETWKYIKSSFLPYEDGYSIFVVTPENVEMQIRMQWRNESQGEILNRFSKYVRAKE